MPSAFALSRGKRHRRDAEPSADQHQRARSWRELKAVAQRTETADDVAGPQGEKLRCAHPDSLEHHLDPVAVDPVDGEGPAQKGPWNSEVDELACANG